MWCLLNNEKPLNLFLKFEKNKAVNHKRWNYQCTIELFPECTNFVNLKFIVERLAGCFSQAEHKHHTQKQSGDVM